ncbi:hypothetical protein ACUY2L_02550 [Corynebacterium mastitidis]
MTKFLAIAATVVATILVILGPSVAYAKDGVPPGFADNYSSCREDPLVNMDEGNFVEKGAKAPGAVGEMAGCAVMAAIKTVGQAAGHKVSQWWDSKVGELSKSMMEGTSEILQTVMTLWMEYSIVGDNADAQIRGVKNIVFSLSFLALVGSLIYGGIQISASRRMGLQDGLEETGSVILRYLLYSTVVPGMVASGISAGDLMAKEIMKSFGVKDSQSFVDLGSLNENMAGPIIMLVLAGICIAGAFVQIIALVSITLVLPVAAGLTPLFAAASFSGKGRSGLDHLTAFMIAAVVYKPAAAVLYAVLMWNVTAGPGQEQKSLIGAMINVPMIALVGFLGPKLVQMLIPLTAQAGGGTAGAALGMGAATDAAIGSALGVVGSGMMSMGKSAAGASGSGSGGATSSVGSGTTGSGNRSFGAASRSGDGGLGAAGVSAGVVGQQAQPSGAGGTQTGMGSSQGAVGVMPSASQPSGAQMHHQPESTTHAGTRTTAAAGGASSGVARGSSSGQLQETAASLGADVGAGAGSASQARGWKTRVGQGAQRAGQAVQAAYRVGKPVVQGGVRAAGAVGVGAAVAGRGLSHVDQVAQRTEALLGGALGTEGSYHGQIRR